MRVVVNHLTAAGAKTGIGHYTSQLLRCLRESAPEDLVETFPHGWLGRVRAACGRLRPPVAGGRMPGRPSPWDRLRGRALAGLRAAGQAWFARQFRLRCSRRRYDLYHEPNYIPLPSDLPTVATVHDLSVLLHPEWHPADRVAHFEKHFRRGLAHCRHFLAISEFGRQEVIRTLDIAPERVTRTYMGVRPGLGRLGEDGVAPVLSRLGLPRRYLLYLGTIEPRKNLEVLLRAYGRLPAPLQEKWPLVLVGAWGWNTEAVRSYFDREARHRGVIHLGYVAEGNLAAVYGGARALVYPSRYEGFGLPPVEMMACGGAVLAARVGALVETVGARAHLLHPDDEDGWCQALARVVSDDDWWRSLRRGVQELVRSFTWEQCAADTLRAYRSVVEGRPPAEPARHRVAG